MVERGAQGMSDKHPIRLFAGKDSPPPSRAEVDSRAALSVGKHDESSQEAKHDGAGDAWGEEVLRVARQPRLSAVADGRAYAAGDVLAAANFAWQAATERAWVKLRPYLRHRECCSSIVPRSGLGPPCDCGLAAAIREGEK
jgi:hypothetical protein